MIENGRVLLIRRGSEPRRGEWSIPGGMLELAETLEEGVVRELREETGLQVRVLELLEVFDRIVYATEATPPGGGHNKPRFHYVIVDYLCERVSGEPLAASDVTDAKFVREAELEKFSLPPIVLRILHKAFALYRERGLSS